jgi:hypothetical protein
VDFLPDHTFRLGFRAVFDPADRRLPVAVVRQRRRADPRPAQCLSPSRLKVCTEASGKVAKLDTLSQWTFRPGRKTAVRRQHGTDFNTADYGLKPAHCEVVHASICLRGRAGAGLQFAPPLSPLSCTTLMTAARVAFESNLVEKGNWKLVFEEQS